MPTLKHKVPEFEEDIDQEFADTLVRQRLAVYNSEKDMYVLTDRVEDAFRPLMNKKRSA